MTPLPRSVRPLLAFVFVSVLLFSAARFPSGRRVLAYISPGDFINAFGGETSSASSTPPENPQTPDAGSLPIPSLGGTQPVTQPADGTTDQNQQPQQPQTQNPSPSGGTAPGGAPHRPSAPRTNGVPDTRNAAVQQPSNGTQPVQQQPAWNAAPPAQETASSSAPEPATVPVSVDTGSRTSAATTHGTAPAQSATSVTPSEKSSIPLTPFSTRERGDASNLNTTTNNIHPPSPVERGVGGEVESSHSSLSSVSSTSSHSSSKTISSPLKPTPKTLFKSGPADVIMLLVLPLLATLTFVLRRKQRARMTSA